MCSVPRTPPQDFARRSNTAQYSNPDYLLGKKYIFVKSGNSTYCVLDGVRRVCISRGKMSRGKTWIHVFEVEIKHFTYFYICLEGGGNCDLKIWLQVLAKRREGEGAGASLPKKGPAPGRGKDGEASGLQDSGLPTCPRCRVGWVKPLCGDFLYSNKILDGIACFWHREMTKFSRFRAK